MLHQDTARHRTHRRSDRPGRRTRALRPVLVALAVAQLVVPTPAQAQPTDGRDATYPTAQVRVFQVQARPPANNPLQRAIPTGGGTLVDRNWVLTTTGAVPNFPQRNYTLAFDTVNTNDGVPSQNLRRIDRVVPHPNGSEVLMVHFADPVPATAWVPPLAAQQPERLTPALMFGWRSDTGLFRESEPGTLGVVNTTVWNPQVDQLLVTHPNVIGGPYSTVPPLAVNALSGKGVAGNGIFSRTGTLLGIRGTSRFFFPSGARYDGTLGQPVWRYADWIREVIASPEPQAGPRAGSTHADADSPRGDGRTPRAAHATRASGTSAGTSTGTFAGTDSGLSITSDLPPDATIPMSTPPQEPACNLEAGACADEHWVRSTITGPQGAVAATCAPASPDGCTFAGKTYKAGESTTLALGIGGGTGVREALTWCVAQADNPRTYELSFTNADSPQGQLGYGWWIVTKDFFAADPASSSGDGPSLC